MAEANKQAEGQGSDNPSLVAKLMMPILAGVNVLGLGVGLFLTYKSTLAYQPPVLREPAALAELEKDRQSLEFTESVFYTMPEFTVNLDGQPRRLIRVEMTFEMLDKDGFEEIVRNSPAARDAIVRILNKKKFDDLESIQGKLFLKDQITLALHQSLQAGVVKDIYFSQFLVQ
jgi:flagellar FliL protein